MQVTKIAVSLQSHSTNAEIAQLVEHDLAKVGVASSSLVFRSLKGDTAKCHPFILNYYSLYLWRMKLIQRNMAQIIALCEKHKVLQLYVFGSILTDKFNKDSDVDFTVIFNRDALPLLVYGENYFEFKFALEELLKRDVDLVEYNAVRNPYFKEELDETKQLVYGQAS